MLAARMHSGSTAKEVLPKRLAVAATMRPPVLSAE
jgi:hypothetical protein